MGMEGEVKMSCEREEKGSDDQRRTRKAEEEGGGRLGLDATANLQ